MAHRLRHAAHTMSPLPRVVHNSSDSTVSVCPSLMSGPHPCPPSTSHIAHASQKIEKHVADGLQVITATLLNTTMGIDRGVPRGAREVQTLLYLHVRLVEVPLAQSKVDHVQMMRLVLDTPHEVLGFDVSMDNALRVQVLHSAQELLSDEDSGLDGETSLALMSAILQTLHRHGKNRAAHCACPIPVRKLMVLCTM